jgi:hypothetical protein
MLEDKAEYIYNEVLKMVESMIGNKTTHTIDLNECGYKILKKYRGTHASDLIPNDLKKGESCIINTDDSKGWGEHWVGVYKNKDNNLWFYDSFARPHYKILKSLKKSGNGTNIKGDTKDKEQKMSETNCGARSLSFLFCCENWGKMAMKI